MARKRNKVTSAGKITSQQLFDFRKPKYDAWAYRGGVHGPTSYDRRLADAEAERDIEEGYEDYELE